MNGRSALRAARAVILIALLFAAGGCSPQFKKYSSLMDEARDLMDRRYFLRAQPLLEEASALSPRDAEAFFLLGETYFRMGRYAEAEYSFREALRRDPASYNSLHLLWAARLQGAYGTPGYEVRAEEVRNSIMEVERRAETGLRYAAYMGYYYLGDRDARLPLILELAGNSKDIDDEELREQVESAMLEELIVEPDREARAGLARVYLKEFPLKRGAGTAARLLFSGLDDEEADILETVTTYLRDLPETPYLYYAAARELVERDTALEEAISLLQEGLRLMDEGALKESHGHYTREGWAKYLSRIRADHLSLLGRAYFMTGDMAEATRHLELAGELHGRSEALHYQRGLVHLALGEREEAMAAFLRAVQINDRTEAEAFLSGLLKEEYGYEGPAREFFGGQEGVVSFKAITERAGLSGVRSERVAWGDFDGDGLDDLLFSGPRLFRNSGDAAFKEVTAEAGLGGLKGYHGGVWGDYDNDGRLDLYLISHRGNRLFRNEGKGRLVEVSGEAFPLVPARPTEAAAWGAMDGDGLLDLYVANYELGGIGRAICAGDRLWRNKGDGTFEDATESAGVVSPEAMCGRGVAWGDYNADGLQDIMVSNYRLDPNFLWTNAGGGRFVDMAEEKGVRGRGVEGAFGHTIGSEFGDLDGDLDLDLVSANLAHPPFLDFSDATMVLMNGGPPGFRFSDAFESSGVAYEETHAEPSLADVDNDGDLDLYITSVYSGRNSFLYLNDGTGRFKDVSWMSGSRVKNGWGAAFSDFDRDGDLDLAVASADGVRILENQGTKNHWLSVRVESSTCQRQGVGSRVEITYGPNRQVREIAAGSGAGSQDQMLAHFGLGPYDGNIGIAVRTACGKVIEKTVERPDATVVVRD